MDLRPDKWDKDVNLKDRIDTDKFDVDSENVTAFLGGVAFSITLITVLSLTGLVGNSFLDSSDNSIEVLPPEKVGNRTVDMLNKRVLHDTTNNVTGELVDVYSADSETLPNFYEVEMMVKNPTSQQVTTVYVKKDASLVFLNHPRYFESDRWRSQQHQ